MNCPNCQGTGGLTRLEWHPYNRIGAWDGEVLDADAAPLEIKAGRWECLDCGHRFNGDPRAKEQKQ